jgi:hypothetical protein
MGLISFYLNVRSISRKIFSLPGISLRFSVLFDRMTYLGPSEKACTFKDCVYDSQQMPCGQEWVERSLFHIGHDTNNLLGYR